VIKGQRLYKVKVLIKRRSSILDPQGKAVEKGAKNLGLTDISGTRIGKYIEFLIDSNDEKITKKEANEYCSKLLANPIMEDYVYSLEKLS